ncbi:hypothetical protein PUNSTDRAFT_68115 [Punctularia strigosozonata HHB-11173 SS5]|uniref:uncharacterized protein n=1 Tax=Punctularia strigosozonata (strain HHB-11173) TaxID=741275 RepID=UPI0004417FCD|nr:uncharacterized protein PUNSTDRAFT_68115 [Punctularia strigosozonata HHB-11173 SS5]EIN09350.1 hypothetical protein PUNSTDRAFT_68115 [Punctularia strigosozonata HHB-11173 SS5]
MICNARSAVLHVRYRQHGDVRDLEHAVACIRDTVKSLPYSHIPIHATAIRHLAGGLRFLFEEQGNVQDLDDAIALARRLVAGTPATHVNYMQSVTTLAGCLGIRYDFASQIEHLDECIIILREACSAAPDPKKVSLSILMNLGIALRCRFMHTGRLSDLDDALDLYVDRLNVMHRDSAGRAELLRELGLIYGMRYEETKDEADLERAIRYSRDSYELHPPGSRHPDPSMPANALSGLLIFRYRLKKHMEDLIESVHYGTISLGLRPRGHPFRAEAAETLVEAKRTLAVERMDPALLSESISLLEETLTESERSDSPFVRGALISQKAGCLAARFKLCGCSDDIVASRALYEKATTDTLAPPVYRFKYSREWIRAAADSDDHEGLSTAHERGLDLLSRIAYLGLDNASRLRLLRTIPLLSSDAATHALGLGEPERAIEMLEQGRSIFWGQALHLRTPLAGLPNDMLEKLHNLSQALEQSPSGAMDDMAIAERRSVADEYEALVEKVRYLPGQERFLRTPLFSDLRECAEGGMVVVLVASKASCEVIIIRNSSSPAERLSLRSLTYDHLKELVKAIGALTGNDSTYEDDTTRLQPSVDRLKMKKTRVSSANTDDLAAFLAELWSHIVQPIIDYVGLSDSELEGRPRVWWCPTGLFTSLPLHAAGSRGEYASDYFVSSYTPTLGTLLALRKQKPISIPRDFTALLVAQASAADLPPFTSVDDEINGVVEALPATTTVNVFGTKSSGKSSDVESVLASLPKVSMIHLACHAQQNYRNPLSSAFCLADGRLSVSDLMKVKMRDDTFFAFLSSCQSAAGDPKLPDEAIHLAGTMLYVGFKSVVATAWTMNDADGPRVAADVYRTMFKETAVSNPIDCSSVAFGLDSAVRKMRAQGLQARRWATYVHIGL